ncbi:cyanophycinase [Alteromonas oceanisediminis]|uniref:cyanophycinase n=1 Tax=Alteromonas oceanisediminis TaxID=2836180 RepID=UPI001BDB40E9|nr:cyanophycinase [Alteromonas oceanisediminis]MBT0586165.1 cyanophycinase [Alteromonas oceanisediminis]
MKTRFALSMGLLAFISFESTACISAESENNNTESRADSPLCAAQPVSARIGSRSDTDWFAIDGAVSGDVSIALSHDTNDDFDWSLYGSSGPAIVSSTTANNPETASATLGSDDYYLKVTRYRGTGPYTLTLTSSSSPSACNTYGARPALPSGLVSSLVGNSSDVCPTLPNSAGVLLMGGGSDVDDAFVNRVAPHIDGGDIVVLRTSGTDGYNDYLKNLTNADSVETLIVDTRTKANSAYVSWAVETAEFVWIAGGDQSDYINQWKNTAVSDAIDAVYARNGIIGGTSAGNAVQSSTVYDPDGVAGAVSDEVVTDFCDSSIQFSTDFLSTPVMQNTLTDTHFYERDRMGRLVVLMTHLSQQTTAIGVSEATSLYVREDGSSVVDGDNEVYVLRRDSQTNVVQASCGQAVRVDDVLRYRLLSGDSFDFSTLSGSVSPIRISLDGRNTNYWVTGNPY